MVKKILMILSSLFFVHSSQAQNVQRSSYSTLHPSTIHSDIYSRNVDNYQVKTNIYDTIGKMIQEKNRALTDPYSYTIPNNFNGRPPANSSDGDIQYTPNNNNSNLNNSNIYRPQQSR